MKRLSFLFGKTPKTPATSPKILPISKEQSIVPSPKSPPQSWGARLNEYKSIPKGKESIHLDLSAKRNKLKKICGNEMEAVCNKIKEIIESNVGRSFSLDLSGNCIDEHGIVALDELLVRTKGVITTLDIGQPAASFSFAAQLYLNNILQNDRGLKEINFTGGNVRSRDINCDDLQERNKTLEKINGYPVATTKFDDIKLNKHKDERDCEEIDYSNFKKDEPTKSFTLK